MPPARQNRGPPAPRRRLYGLAMSAGAALAILLIVKTCAPLSVPRPLIDRDGRVVIYHGVNVANSAKHAPGHRPWQTRRDFERLREWGFNLVRYLVFWEAVEPRPGEYDDGYLDRVIRDIRSLQDLGIDVLLDFHQDLYNRRFGGNGFPDWTVNTGGHVFHRRSPWQMNYLEPAVRACYRHFWRSAELQRRYIAMLEHVMERVDAEPNVIGVEIMNEPWPDRLLSFERETLTGFYERVLEMKRRRRFRCRLFFEPVIYTSAGLRSRLRFRPGNGPDGRPDCVYSVHYYDPFCHEGRPYIPMLGPFLMRCAVRGKVRDANRFGVPVLFTEFGISPQVRGFRRFLSDWLRRTERYQIGWVCWSWDRSDAGGFGLVDKKGRPRANLEMLVQVYAQRIAGRNIRIRRERQVFELAYDPVPTGGPTVIFVPPGLRNVRIRVNGALRPFPAGCTRFECGNPDGATRQTIRVEWGKEK